MASCDYAGESATQAIYTNEWAPYRAQYGATTCSGRYRLLLRRYRLCPAGLAVAFLAGPVLVALCPVDHRHELLQRRPDRSCGTHTSHGLQIDFSYTLSNSIDYGSDAERSTEFGTNSTNTGSFSEILNTWKPYLNRGVSDFDTRHLITVDWVYQLPFGRGKARCWATPMASSMHFSADGSCPASTAGPAACHSPSTSPAGPPTGRSRATAS